jgi:hypothetical protein
MNPVVVPAKAGTRSRFIAENRTPAPGQVRNGVTESRDSQRTVSESSCHYRITSP